jgi:hypothetical protein
MLHSSDFEVLKLQDVMAITHWSGKVELGRQQK